MKTLTQFKTWKHYNLGHIENLEQIGKIGHIGKIEYIRKHGHSGNLRYLENYKYCTHALEILAQWESLDTNLNIEEFMVIF